jgi:long-chain fatty acid transport protein
VDRASRHLTARGAVAAAGFALGVAGAAGGVAPAQASPADVFGLGSRQTAQAGAGVASVDDMAAPLVNPAGLARSRGKRLTLGAQGAFANLKINDRRTGLSDPVGGIFGLTAPAPLGGPLADRIHVGLAMYLLPRTIARIVARFPDEPFYPYYQGRTERLVIVPGVGVRVAPGVDVGLAANFLAGLGGALEASEGATRALDARVDEKVPGVARIIAGVAWQPLDALRVAAVFRQRFDVPFATRAKTEVAGEPIDLDLRASGQFSPTQVAAGVAWLTEVATVSFDLTYARWSTYAGPFVAVKSELPLVGPLAAELPAVPWKDTFGARLGAEAPLGTRAVLRGGYGFETSPVPAVQHGVTNLLDGPHHVVGAGLGWSWDRGGGKRVRVDLHLQAQLVQPRTLRKVVLAPGEDAGSFDGLRDEVTDVASDPATQGAQISNPGYPRIDSGGQVYSGGLTMEVEL